MPPTIPRLKNSSEISLHVSVYFSVTVETVDTDSCTDILLFSGCGSRQCMDILHSLRFQDSVDVITKGGGCSHGMSHAKTCGLAVVTLHSEADVELALKVKRTAWGLRGMPGIGRGRKVFGSGAEEGAEVERRMQLVGLERSNQREFLCTAHL